MKKTGRVTVKHVDMATGENLEPPVTSTYKFHEHYETGPKDIFLYYIYDSVEGIPSGEITSDMPTINISNTSKNILDIISMIKD